MRWSYVQPRTLRKRTILRAVALAQLVYAVLILPVWILWYGASTLDEWGSQLVRQAALTLVHGRAGPVNSRGEVYCLW